MVVVVVVEEEYVSISCSWGAARVDRLTSQEPSLDVRRLKIYVETRIVYASTQI